MRQPRAVRGLGPFFRSDPLADLLGDPGVGSSDEDEGEDLDEAPPSDVGPLEEERTRPGEYPESEFLDEDHEDATDEDEDEDDEDDLRDDGRSWKSVAKEERRRRQKYEGQRDELVAQMLAGAGPARQPEEPPEKPPHSLAEIAEDLQEGRTETALRKQAALDNYRERKLRRELSVESEQRAVVHRLENHMRQNLNLTGQTEFAQIVRERAQDVMSEFPGMTADQANLYAAGLVGAEMFEKGATPRRSLREEDKERRARRRPNKDRRGTSRTPRKEAEGTSLTAAQRVMLEKHGLFNDYGRPFKDPRKEARRQYKLRRLFSRISEVQEDSR
jgi:hypothetical protein